MQPVSSTRIAAGARSAELVCHMGVLSGAHPPNTIEAIGECFAAGAGRIEIDVHSLAGDDYVVYHDGRFDAGTTGAGPVGRATPDDVRALRFRGRAGRPPLLSEVVALARGCATELQLDWKDLRPLPPERLRALVETVAPVRGRVIVSAAQDWNLRRLHAFDPTFPIGFDPGHYLAPPREGARPPLPARAGAYGYLDDHPLAVGHGDVGAYLGERMAALAAQAPGTREYFLDYRLVLRMLDDGFDVAAWLHARGIGANAWTLDHAGEASLKLLRRLLDAGVDRITTNTASAWRAALGADGAAVS